MNMSVEASVPHFEPEKTALLLIDMQNEFCSDDGYVAKQGWDIEPMKDMATRLKDFRWKVSGRIPVIHVRGEYGEPYMVNQMKRRLAALRIKPYCAPGTEGHKFYPGFEPNENEIVVTKRSYSAFSNTELDLILRNMQIDTLIVTGTFTNVCVDTTVRDGYSRGYYILIPRDLTACPDEGAHKHALETLGQFFGTVTDSGNILDKLGGNKDVGCSQ